MTMAMVYYCYCLSPNYLRMGVLSFEKHYSKTYQYPIDYYCWMSVARLMGLVVVEVILSYLVAYVSPGIEVGKKVVDVAGIVVAAVVLTMYHWWLSLEVLCDNGII